MKITYFWDNQDSENEGWYVEVQDADGNYLDNSVKSWFPVAVDDFGRDGEAGLIAALKEEYPDAEIMGVK